jgi:N-methylhydantoinase B
VQILRYELVEDSGGPGKWRGGLGARRDYAFPERGATFTILADRDKKGPYGLFGGLEGRTAAYVLNPDGEARKLGSKSTIEVEVGDVVSYRTCGGGGYGRPFERDPKLVLNDVREGKISLDTARESYGVAVDSVTWSVDQAETTRLRDSAESTS